MSKEAPNIAVVTDSAADLTELQRKEYGIRVVPALIMFGDETFQDGVDMTLGQMFAKVAEGGPHPTTAAPTPQAFKDIYLQHEAQGIISVHIGKGLSTMVNAATIAARDAAEESRKEITVVDSGSVSMFTGFMAIEAALKARDGASVVEILTHLQDVRRRTRIIAALSNLDYLRRGGRASNIQSFLAAALKIEPILEIRDGEVLALEKVRTRKQSKERLFQHVAGMKPLERVHVLHGDAEDDARELANRISGIYQGDILVSEITPVIGVHGGPGILGVCAMREKTE
jgi:DegV family protein with EDD domain